METFTVAIEVTDKRCNPALEVKGHLTVGALIHEVNGHAAV